MKKLEDYTDNELESLIEKEKSVKKRAKLYSLYGDKCSYSDKSFDFLTSNLINEKADLTIIKKEIIIILLTKFNKRKKEIKKPLNFAINRNLPLLSESLKEKNNYNEIAELIEHPILKIYTKNFTFFDDNNYELDQEFFYIRSPRRKIQFAEYIYLKGYFEGKTLLSEIKHKEILQNIKKKGTTKIIYFKEHNLEKKTFDLISLLIYHSLNLKNNQIQYYLLEMNIDPEFKHEYLLFNTDNNDFYSQNPRWLAFVNKKLKLCVIVRLNLKDPYYSRCIDCGRSFVRCSSPKYEDYCFNCWFEKNIHIPHNEAIDIYNFGSHKRFLSTILKGEQYKIILKNYKKLLASNPTSRKIRNFYLKFREFLKKEREGEKGKKQDQKESGTHGWINI